MDKLTDNERQQILSKAFPAKVSGFNRPSEVEADLPYSDTFPSFSEKDKVINTLQNLVIRQMLSNDDALKNLINELTERLANADIQLVTQSVKGLMRPEDKKKLDEIEAHATNYKHPSVGKAGTYTKVTTDSQGHVKAGENPTTLAGYGITDAASKNHGYHVPTPERTVSNSRFLRNDNTWADLTPNNIGAYSKTESDSRLNDAIHNLYIVSIRQTAGQQITVNCNGKDHITTFIAPGGSTYTAKLEVTMPYWKPGKLSSTSGTINDDLTISATAAQEPWHGGDPGAGAGGGGH